MVNARGSVSVGLAATGTTGPTTNTAGSIASTIPQMNTLSVVLEQPTPLAMIPNSAYSGCAGTMASAGTMYSTTANATPSSNIVPNDVFEAHRQMQAINVTHLNSMNLAFASAPRSGNPTWAELDKVKDELARVMRDKLGIDLGAAILYQKPYDDSFHSVPYPVG